MSLQFVSLFTGIGGLDLGLERAGLRCVAQVEIDPHCRAVLARHWSAVPKFGDVRTFTRRSIHARVDLVAGGFPCQDVSNAGHKVGLGGARSGLWSEMLRVIRAFRPAYALVENVPGLRARGFDRVLGDLAACGYSAEWDCLPAAAFGAPHLRDRVFLVAYARRVGWDGPAVFSPLDPPQPRPWPPAEDGRLVAAYGRRYRGYPRHLRVGHGLPERWTESEPVATPSSPTPAPTSAAASSPFMTRHRASRFTRPAARRARPRRPHDARRPA
jgi:DNA-cytosine methyltransferase